MPLRPTISDKKRRPLTPDSRGTSRFPLSHSPTHPQLGFAHKLSPAFEGALTTPDLPEESSREGSTVVSADPGPRARAYVEVVLQRHRLAIPLDQVDRVLPAAAPHRLPGAPPHVEGVLSLAGEVRAVVSLYARLGLPTPSLDPSQHLVLTRGRAHDVLLRVDRVDGVRTLDDGALHSARDLTGDDEGSGAVAATEDGLLLVRDLKTVLDHGFMLDVAAAVDTRLVDGGEA